MQAHVKYYEICLRNKRLFSYSKQIVLLNSSIYRSFGSATDTDYNINTLYSV